MKKTSFVLGLLFVSVVYCSGFQLIEGDPYDPEAPGSYLRKSTPCPTHSRIYDYPVGSHVDCNAGTKTCKSRICWNEPVE